MGVGDVKPNRGMAFGCAGDHSSARSTPTHEESTMAKSSPSAQPISNTVWPGMTWACRPQRDVYDRRVRTRRDGCPHRASRFQ